MLKKSLAFVLCILMLVSSISCLFTVNAATKLSENMVTLTNSTTITSVSKDTVQTRLSGWTRNSGGSAAVTTENGEVIASRTGYAGGQLFTNTFTIEKNSTYRFSFEVKGLSTNVYERTVNGEAVPSGIDFVLNDFNVLKDDGTEFTGYSEGKTDYAHTNKSKYGYAARSGIATSWTIELADGTTATSNGTKYSSFGRKIGTSDAYPADLQTVNLNKLYADWRTVTCEFSVPDEDEYTSADIALGFILPAKATDMYIKNVSFCKVLPDEPAPTSVPVVIVDAEGNVHPSADDITASTTVTDNGDDTYTLKADFDTMDGVNKFVGFYEGEKLLSANTTFKVGSEVDFKNVTAKIVCNSVITGGLGFEGCENETNLRVDPPSEGTLLYDDKWGISYTGGYETETTSYKILSTYGDVTTLYTPSYDPDAGKYDATGSITVKPYSGNSMIYFIARFRNVVRRLDNLKPNTKYNISFYTYNLSQWDFFSKAFVADTHSVLANGKTSSGESFKTYASYITPTTTDEYGKTVIADTSAVRSWNKITLEFTTDEDDTTLYLYFNQQVGNNTSKTSKQFIDNLTCFPAEVEPSPITSVPLSVVDVNGYAHPSPEEIPATTTAVYNEDDTITVSIDYDAMDNVNTFKGWYEDEKFLSNDTTYTLGTDVDEHKVKAKMLCRSVITGGMGFESYKQTTNLRVSDTETNTNLENIPPFDDRWGQIYGSYQQASDYAFDIKANYGELKTKYTPTYNTETGTWDTDYITVKPHSGNSMFYFAARFRTIVRKLDNLKPNTSYQLSFYVYNLSEWDFLHTATIADSYLLKNGTTTSTNDIKVYAVYRPDIVSQNGENVLVNQNEVRNWSKIIINFTTDSDDTELYLHLRQEVGNNSSSTSKQFIDDLTCSETVLGYAGNAIRAKNEAKPQALRYKFFISNDKANAFGDMTTAKIGLLAVKNEVCGNDTLEIGKKYTFNGEECDIIDVEVNPDTNFQYVAGDNSNIYFTAALYNIGAKGSGVDYDAFAEDYAVRPYVIYEDENGIEMLIYGDTVNANVFNVVYTIVRDSTSDNDVASAKSMLENKNLASAFYEWQTTDNWYIGESQAKNYAYSFAVIGDVQKTTGYYPDKLHYIYDWIINNADDKNIQYVMGLGDLSEHANPDAEWPIVTEQHYRLEQAGLNQSIVRGNHDWRFDSYITKDKFGSKLTGTYDATMKNTYRLITINGIKYMMLTLNLFPTDAEIAWAKQVVDNHPDYNVILTTHAYFDHDMSLTDDADIDWVDDKTAANSGQDIYDKLVSQCSNIVLVMCGHRYPPDDGPNYRITTRDDGSKVMEMMINPQRMESNGGRSYGMLAMLYISEDGRSVQLEYFSTISGMFYKDKFQFEFELDLVD